MIVIKTPLRVSFFGGGSDLPEFFRGSHSGGAVLGSAIDKFIYHTVSPLRPWLFQHSIRFSYSKVELVKALDDLQHIPFREVMRYCGWSSGVEVNLASDLPSFSGLGSSSSFTVGLLNGLNALKGKRQSCDQLAKDAIHIEREILRESVGLQDQIFASFGGFNLIRFNPNGDYNVEPISISAARLEELEKSLVLVFTGVTRRAQEVEKSKIETMSAIRGSLENIFKQVEKAYNILSSEQDISLFGKLLNQAWAEKRNLSGSVSNTTVDDLYKSGLDAGALGGKLLGAGGGGFILFFVPLGKRKQFDGLMARYHSVPFSLNARGSTIIEI